MLLLLPLSKVILTCPASTQWNLAKRNPAFGIISGLKGWVLQELKNDDAFQKMIDFVFSNHYD